MRGIPEVTVTYSSIYDRVLASYHGSDLTIAASHRGKAQAAMIQRAWDSRSSQILHTMVRLSGLRWRRREIRAYVVSNVRYPFSEPLTLWIGEKGKKLDYQITSLIHELSHTLLVDNEGILSDYWKALEAHHKPESQTTIIHIPVQAMVIESLGAVFGKDAERYIKHERWWEYSKANSDMKISYKKSWDIVAKESGAAVLNALRNAADGSAD